MRQADEHVVEMTGRCQGQGDGSRQLIETRPKNIATVAAHRSRHTHTSNRKENKDSITPVKPPTVALAHVGGGRIANATKVVHYYTRRHTRHESGLRGQG